MERLPDGAGMPEQGDEAAGEVVVVGQRPQRGAVAVDDDLLAPSHPRHRRPAAVERHQRPVVGVRGPHDRHRKALLPVGGREQVLAGDLVAGVLPERVAQRSGLHDRKACRRCLVGGCGADEHVLPGPPAEQVHVGADVDGSEGQPVDDRIELLVAERLLHRPGVSDVGAHNPHLRRQRTGLGLPPVQHLQLDTPLHRKPRAGGADHTAPPNEQHLEGTHPSSVTSGAPRSDLLSGLVGAPPQPRSARLVHRLSTTGRPPHTRASAQRARAAQQWLEQRSSHSCAAPSPTAGS